MEEDMIGNNISNWKLTPAIFQGPNWYGTSTLKEQTLEIGVSSTFGIIPIDDVFARIIPSSEWKLSKSARGKASPPIASASSLARSVYKQCSTYVICH